jgi:uncharacterized protein YndB with AHSA1/START domain
MPKDIIISRQVQAPPALVFSTWTTAEHLGRWWGPNGFSTTTKSMDFRVGGRWVYIMHGPDGTDYDNWIEYTLITEPERIEYDHGEKEGEPRWFQGEATFEPRDGGTLVTLRLKLASAEQREEFVKFGAETGGEQTLAKLAEYAEKLSD